MKGSELDTDMLVTRAAAGDVGARDQLLDIHRDRLRRMVDVRMDRRLPSRLDASDVVQDALAEASQQLDRYVLHRELPFYPWLRQIAWQRLMQLHRQHVQCQKRSVTREQGADRYGLPDESTFQLVNQLVGNKTSPSHDAVRDEEIGTLRAVGQLGQDDRIGGRRENQTDIVADDFDLVGVVGDFRIVGEIGRGGMGVVYEAEQISLGRRVALKVLPYAAVMDPRHLARFKTEAQAAASLHHSNIVPVFFVGSERGIHYYAMQFIEGQNYAKSSHSCVVFRLCGQGGFMPTNWTRRSTPRSQ